MIRILTLLVLAGISVNAQTYTSGNWKYTLTNGEATITGYTGSGGAVTIPSSVNGNPVVQVGGGNDPIQGWFPNQQSISSVIISPGISSIGRYAFYQSSLASVEIPTSVTGIGEYAFYNCANLIELRIPNSVVRIDDGALCSLNNLASFTLESPNSSFTYQNGVLFNHDQTLLIVAFPKCLSGSTYTIPNTVTSIGVLAFLGCENLANITIPSSVISIGNGAFANCVSLVSIAIPNGVTTIGNYAFNSCTLLENITIPATVTSIGDYAFDNCPSLLVSSVISHLVTNQASNYTAGRQSVLNNPNSFSLYTTNQIHNLGLGGIVLNRNTNNQLVLKYQVLQSSDLQNWSPYQLAELVISNAASDKMFLRVQAVENYPPPSSSGNPGNFDGSSDSGPTNPGGAGDGGMTGGGGTLGGN